MNNFFLILSALALLIGSIYLVRVFIRLATLQSLLDQPNTRSSHTIPVPRGAGIVFILVWSLVAYALYYFESFPPFTLSIFLPGTLMLAIVGFWDDLRGLGVKQRLAVQLVAAIFAAGMIGGLPEVHIFSEVTLQLELAGIILSVVLLIASTNIYNFMDGLDGMAATQALFLFGAGGLLFWNIEQTGFALLCWALVISVAGFLVSNWPVARVFMGDSGSCCLGFLAALFAIAGERFFALPIILWLLLYSAFWFDTTLTLFRRLIHREKIMTAHRMHAYQRLHQVGFSHQEVLWSTILLNTIIAAAVLWASRHLAHLRVVCCGIFSLLMVVYLWIEYKCPMWSKNVRA